MLPVGDEALRTAYADNPVARRAARGAAAARGRAHARSRAAACRASTAAAPIDYSTLRRRSSRSAIGSGFVGFTWDLGTDAPARGAASPQARIAADENRLAIERELRELEAAVRATQRAAEERLAALDTAEAAVGQAEENLRIRQQQFDVGRATSDDVLDAAAPARRSSAPTLATALYQAHTRRAELQQLMGLPLEPTLAAAEVSRCHASASRSSSSSLAVVGRAAVLVRAPRPRRRRTTPASSRARSASSAAR